MVYPHRASLKNMNWASIPKVVGSIPTVAGHIFQARSVWIYTQSNITNNPWEVSANSHFLMNHLKVLSNNCRLVNV